MSSREMSPHKRIVNSGVVVLSTLFSRVVNKTLAVGKVNRIAIGDICIIIVPFRKRCINENWR
jgi:hypothetical protein